MELFWLGWIAGVLIGYALRGIIDTHVESKRGDDKRAAGFDPNDSKPIDPRVYRKK